MLKKEVLILRVESIDLEMKRSAGCKHWLIPKIIFFTFFLIILLVMHNKSVFGDGDGDISYLAIRTNWSEDDAQPEVLGPGVHEDKIMCFYPDFNTYFDCSNVLSVIPGTSITYYIAKGNENCTVYDETFPCVNGFDCACQITIPPADVGQTNQYRGCLEIVYGGQNYYLESPPEYVNVVAAGYCGDGIVDLDGPDDDYGTFWDNEQCDDGCLKGATEYLCEDPEDNDDFCSVNCIRQVLDCDGVWKLCEEAVASGLGFPYNCPYQP